MNSQMNRVYDTRTFRIAVIAVAAAAVLVLAAYLFGSGLSADTSQSVARSPLGSSLTAVRESRLDDFYARASLVGAAAATLRVGSRLDDYYGRMSMPVRADSRTGDYFGRSSPGFAPAP